MVAGTGRGGQPPLKRTEKYATLALNRIERRPLLAYSRVTGRFLRPLGRSVAGHHLDDPRVLWTATGANRWRVGLPTGRTKRCWTRWTACAVPCHAPWPIPTGWKEKLFARLGSAQRHDAFWTLLRDARLGAVLRGEAPGTTPAAGAKWKGIPVAVLEGKEAVRFRRRPLGKPPRVHRHRTLALDSTLYRVFEQHGRPYVSVAGPTPHKRCNLPWRDHGRVSGNTLHLPYDPRTPARPAAGPTRGLDAGGPEALATFAGENLGQGPGALLERLSEQSMETGKARNELFQVAKKAVEGGNAAKAARLRRDNLAPVNVRPVPLRRVRAATGTTGTGTGCTACHAGGMATRTLSPP